MAYKDALVTRNRPTINGTRQVGQGDRVKKLVTNAQSAEFVDLR